MTCKAEKAMERYTAKVDYWLDASSPDEMASKLRSRYGGTFDEWQREVKQAIADKSLLEKFMGGKHGYRTRNEKERQLAAASYSPTSVRKGQEVRV